MFLFNKAKISSHDESDEWFWQGPGMVNPKTQFSVEEMIRARVHRQVKSREEWTPSWDLKHVGPSVHDRLAPDAQTCYCPLSFVHCPDCHHDINAATLLVFFCFVFLIFFLLWFHSWQYSFYSWKQGKISYLTFFSSTFCCSSFVFAYKVWWVDPLFLQAQRLQIKKVEKRDEADNSIQSKSPLKVFGVFFGREIIELQIIHH